MKIALGIEYNGSAYYGWQRQIDVASVQAKVEQAISFVANHKCEVVCAGRTDTGVHATGQVIHFETESIRDHKAWIFGINSNLPKDVAVTWCHFVDEDFHARFSAMSRRYRYIIYNNKLRPAIFPEGVTHHPKPLDEKLMQQACSILVGEHDFSSFRSSQCQAHTPVRTVEYIDITRQGKYIIVDIKANAFLHHMVRNIVGCLLEIGMEKRNIEWLEWVLQARKREVSAPTAKAAGLYLVDVGYPEKFKLPKNELGPLFLTGI